MRRVVMDIRVLAVTADRTERRILRRLLANVPGDVNRIALRFTCRHGTPPRIPDILLINMQGCASTALLALYTTAPVILLVSTLSAEAASGTVRVQLAQASRQLLRELIACVVAASRAGLASGLTGVGGTAVLAAIADAVISTRADGTVAYCNPAAERLMQLDRRQMLGQPITSLMLLQDPTTLGPIVHPVLATMSSGSPIRLQAGALLVRPDGSEIMIDDSSAPIANPDGTPAGAVMVFHDITEARELRAQVDYLAWHDFLTGLPNRFAAQRHLNQILLEAHDDGSALATMYLDLDRFKAVNDTLGHAAGDALLVSVAARLRGCVRNVDMISRQGGDEFVVLMAPGSSGQPHAIEAEQVHVGCSIGIALYPEHGRSAESLLRHADTALHSAKASGRNTWRFFRPELLTSAVQRRQLEDGIRSGLELGGFRLFYQPKFSLSSGMLGGCEALLRWHHADWGWVNPASFIRAAEESGLIVPLGKWVLDEAIRQAALWERAGCCPEAIAINVSALELRAPAFPERMAGKIDAAGLDPRRLQLELTESALMRDMRASALALQRLKDIGVSIAIDDFGTGYSSLGYLAELPIDLVKVDRAFVHGIDTAAPRRQALLRAVLTLAQNIALPAVAEGVETAPEKQFLADAGCPLGQGFYFGPAVAAAEFAHAFLDRPADLATAP
ncbi:two-component system response regulator [Massilia sp. YMA4]|nr:two-component system response regulator [Massilia sp. YMA4]